MLGSNCSLVEPVTLRVLVADPPGHVEICEGLGMHIEAYFEGKVLVQRLAEVQRLL
jgi:hypothetical protein